MTRKEKWKKKMLQKEFKREIENIANEKSWKWL